MQTTFTSKLLIVNSILLVLILLLVVFVNYDDLKYKLTDEFYSYISADEYDGELKHYVKQDSVKVDFEGLKDDIIDLPENILKTIETELYSFNWNESLNLEVLNSLYHETVFVQQFPSDYGIGKSLFVITYSNSSANLCHGCKGRISLFELQNVDKNWQLVRKYLAFGYGDEDALEPRGIKLEKIGNDKKYAVVVHTGYSGNFGHDVEYKSVYTEVNDSLNLVFDFTCYETYYDTPTTDIEYTEGFSDFRIIQSEKEFFNIETKSEELEWEDKTPSQVKRYVFNGKEYVDSFEK